MKKRAGYIAGIIAIAALIMFIQKAGRHMLESVESSAGADSSAGEFTIIVDSGHGEYRLRKLDK